MKINNKNNYQSFTSLNNPIKPFSIKTNRGRIRFKEIKYAENFNKNVFKELATFFLDNFASQSSHPFWKSCRKRTKTFNSKVYDNYIKKHMLKPYEHIIKNPDATFLIGRNKRGKISSALIAYPIGLTSVSDNAKTLYLDSIAVNKSYRGNQVGKNIINQVISSIKGKYNDMFLVSYNESVPFYKKLGFEFLQADKDKTLIDSWAKSRSDYPKYASFLSKTLTK